MTGPLEGIVVVELAVALAAALAWRYLLPRAARRRAAPEAEPAWTPDAGEALALLDDADRLFFERALVMEGDTELGLILKNTLDAIGPLVRRPF